MIINYQGKPFAATQSKLKIESEDDLARERVDELNRLKSEDILLFNSSAEEYFIEILCECLDEFENRITQSEAIAETAFRLNVSIVTTKRYLCKHSTKRANFSIVRGFVTCKSHIHPRRKKSL